jgi:hypothetical protein
MDYIPPKRSDRYLWYKNLSGNVVAEAVKFGGLAGDAMAMKAQVDAVIAKMDATEAAAGALDAAREVEQNLETANDALIRAKVHNWKTLPGWAASGSEAVLQMRGSAISFDPNTYKTVLKVTVEADVVKVAFTKKGADGVAIYSRLRGTATWRKLAVDTVSPYFDNTPLAQAGAAEAREYMGRGVLHDQEIGVDSDIVTVAFGG